MYIGTLIQMSDSDTVRESKRARTFISRYHLDGEYIQSGGPHIIMILTTVPLLQLRFLCSHQTDMYIQYSV